MRPSKAVRAVALFEATKGALVFVAGVGTLSFMHRDAQRLAEQLVRHLHLDPAAHYPRVFIDAAAGLTDARLWSLAAAAAAYALLRLVEAYGLWRAKRWAQWLAAVSAAVYVPFEVHALVRGDVWLASLALLVNVFIVGAMIRALRRKRDDHGPYAVSTGSFSTLRQPRRDTAARAGRRTRNRVRLVGSDRPLGAGLELHRPGAVILLLASRPSRLSLVAIAVRRCATAGRGSLTLHPRSTSAGG